MKGLRARWQSLVAMLAVVGPGIITANVDNDAGGIATYSIAGAHFGKDILWVLLPVTVALIVVQEMSARMGAVTNKGLACLLREKFGLRATFWVMCALLVANFGNIVAEFAGIAAAGEIFNVSKFVSVPAAALAVWMLILKMDYGRIEKIFLWACLFYVAYLISGVLARPDWGSMAKASVVPVFRTDFPYFYMLVGIVGTTIAPWMQFYLQAAIVEKGVTERDYRMSRLDVIVGCIGAVIVAYFITIACAATLHTQGIRIDGAEDAAVALRPLAGRWAADLFALGLLNASLFAAAVLPLSTSYYVCEAFGWEAGVDRRISEAPLFYGLFFVLIAVGAGTVLLPGFPLIKVMVISQVANGVLLPIILWFMIQLINDERLMGEYRNSRAWNFVAWATVIIVSALTIGMVVTSF
jgi:NRAMP (natural resistance-associated macrophage protein)-like metal ion transporter